MLRLPHCRSGRHRILCEPNSSCAKRGRVTDGCRCIVGPPPLGSPRSWYIDLGASYIFLLFYGCGIDVAGVVFYSEVFPNHLRAKGVALAIATIALTDLVYLQATATAFANIGWKFFLVSLPALDWRLEEVSWANLVEVFIIISGLGAIWTYVFIPETKVSLADISLIDFVQ